jgi:hypothetical protein
MGGRRIFFLGGGGGTWAKVYIFNVFNKYTSKISPVNKSKRVWTSK